ncbi:MAG: NAD(P)-dependent oxidoreductase [Proteobacteria bacterium]|nr:NAD(P)-dependent oxidoreductase [Pseudomonadota bacterium]
MTRVLSHVPLGLLKRIAEELPDVELEAVPEEGAIASNVEGDVLLTQAWGSPNLGDVVARGVRWVHAYGTGVNAFPFHELGGRPLTCSRGASAIPISEWVLAVMLAAEKKIPESWGVESPEQWNIASLGGLYERTLGLIGIGGIGQAVATRALAFGMRVLAHRRTAAPSPVPGVEIVDLAALLAASDHLVIAAPVTDESRQLLNRETLARVKPGVHLVNVARGELVDQDALREALDDGRVGLASLDVVHPEPLPEGHWLYGHPRVRLSPHTSWSGPGALDRLIEPFIENLQRDRKGEPLLHLVDIELGY